MSVFFFFCRVWVLVLLFVLLCLGVLEVLVVRAWRRGAVLGMVRLYRWGCVCEGIWVLVAVGLGVWVSVRVSVSVSVCRCACVTVCLSVCRAGTCVRVNHCFCNPSGFAVRVPVSVIEAGGMCIRCLSYMSVAV